jgi:hypothetical protein
MGYDIVRRPEERSEKIGHEFAEKKIGGQAAESQKQTALSPPKASFEDFNGHLSRT